MKQGYHYRPRTYQQDDNYQLYTHKFNNLAGMDKFLNIHKPLQLSQYKIDNCNSPTTIKEIKFLIYAAPKSTDPDDFTGEFYQLFKKELT